MVISSLPIPTQREPLQLREANEIFRRAIISSYFQPQLEKIGYKEVKNDDPSSGTRTIAKDYVLQLHFDISTGSEYPDGDEWVIVEYIFPHSVDLPDSLKSRDYFTRLAGNEGESGWRHRELLRFRHGKVKRLEEAVTFIDQKASELYQSLKEASVIDRIRKTAH